MNTNLSLAHKDRNLQRKELSIVIVPKNWSFFGVFVRMICARISIAPVLIPDADEFGIGPLTGRLFQVEGKTHTAHLEKSKEGNLKCV